MDSWSRAGASRHRFTRSVTLAVKETNNIVLIYERKGTSADLVKGSMVIVL